MVEEEGVLQRELAELIRIHHARVFHDVYIFRRPAGRDIRDDNLLQKTPVPREAYEERGPFFDVRGGRFVPSWNRREVCSGMGSCC